MYVPLRKKNKKKTKKKKRIHGGFGAVQIFPQIRLPRGFNCPTRRPPRPGRAQPKDRRFRYRPEVVHPPHAPAPRANPAHARASETSIGAAAVPPRLAMRPGMGPAALLALLALASVGWCVLRIRAHVHLASSAPPFEPRRCGPPNLTPPPPRPRQRLCALAARDRRRLGPRHRRLGAGRRLGRGRPRARTAAHRRRLCRLGPPLRLRRRVSAAPPCPLSQKQSCTPLPKPRKPPPSNLLNHPRARDRSPASPPPPPPPPPPPRAASSRRRASPSAPPRSSAPACSSPPRTA
jgi:hypothetical protein